MQSVYLQRIMKKYADKGYEKTKPKQTQFAKRVKLMQSLYLQRIIKNNAAKGYEKTNPNKPNSNPKSEVRGLSSVFGPLFSDEVKNGTFYAAHPTYIILKNYEKEPGTNIR